MSAFRGKCKFKQYLPNKPNKYILKSFAVVDAKTLYTTELEMYCGKQPKGQFQVDYFASTVVKHIVKCVLNQGWKTTVDDWFTSVPLATALVK